MTINDKMGIILYAVVMLQCAITMTVIFIKSRKTPTLYSFCSAQLLIVIWFIFGINEHMARTTEELLNAVRLTLIPINFIGGFCLLFALFYTEMISVKNKGVIALIFAPLVLTYLPALTHDYFFLVVRSKVIEDPTITKWGIFSIISFIFTYSYIAIGVTIILKKSFKDYKRLKGKVVLLILAAIITGAVTLLNMLVIRNPGYDLGMVSFSISFILISLAIFKYGLFDIVPQAAIDIYRNLDEAVILSDINDNILEFNKAAETEFANNVKLRIGENIGSFFNKLKERSTDHQVIEAIIQNILDHSVKTIDAQIDVLNEDETEVKKRYIFHFKTIFSDRGEEYGRIISFKDNTEMFLLLLEKERSRISADIHDNLSNMINVVSINLEYALKHFEEPNGDKVLTSVQTAFDAAKGIRIILRRILEQLEPIDIERVGLLSALEWLFKKVDQTGLSVEFFHHGIAEENICNKEHAYVIYKTCMEALSNSLFSGKAKKITFVLSQSENNIRLFISDDGIGCESIYKGRGLMGMEKRIHDIGGNVAFESALDEGFNISVQIPCLM